MNNRLIKLNVRRLHNMEVPKLVSRFIVDYETSKTKATDEDFRRLLNRLKGKLDHFLTLERPIYYQKDKSTLREADTIRDNDVKALSASIKAFHSSRRNDEMAAYGALDILLKSYRAITKRNYEEESFAIEDLLGKLKKEPYRSHVTTLDVNKWVTNLTESQRQFESVFSSTTTKKANATKTTAINQARLELFEEYQRLCEYVESMVWVKGSDTYKKILALINKGRQFYVETIGRRSGKGKKGAMTDNNGSSTSPNDAITVEDNVEDGTHSVETVDSGVGTSVTNDEQP